MNLRKPELYPTLLFSSWVSTSLGVIGNITAFLVLCTNTKQIICFTVAVYIAVKLELAKTPDVKIPNLQPKDSQFCLNNFWWYDPQLLKWACQVVSLNLILLRDFCELWSQLVLWVLRRELACSVISSVVRADCASDCNGESRSPSSVKRYFLLQ